MRCLYCNKRLPLRKRLHGERFCSEEHHQNYIQWQQELAIRELTRPHLPRGRRPPAPGLLIDRLRPIPPGEPRPVSCRDLNFGTGSLAPCLRLRNHGALSPVGSGFPRCSAMSVALGPPAVPVREEEIPASGGWSRPLRSQPASTDLCWPRMPAPPRVRPGLGKLLTYPLFRAHAGTEQTPVAGPPAPVTRSDIPLVTPSGHLGKPALRTPPAFRLEAPLAGGAPPVFSPRCIDHAPSVSLFSERVRPLRPRMLTHCAALGILAESGPPPPARDRALSAPPAGRAEAELLHDGISVQIVLPGGPSRSGRRPSQFGGEEPVQWTGRTREGNPPNRPAAPPAQEWPAEIRRMALGGFGAGPVPALAWARHVHTPANIDALSPGRHPSRRTSWGRVPITVRLPSPVPQSVMKFQLTRTDRPRELLAEVCKAAASGRGAMPLLRPLTAPASIAAPVAAGITRNSGFGQAGVTIPPEPPVHPGGATGTVPAAPLAPRPRYGTLARPGIGRPLVMLPVRPKRQLLENKEGPTRRAPRNLEIGTTVHRTALLVVSWSHGLARASWHRVPEACLSGRLPGSAAAEAPAVLAPVWTALPGPAGPVPARLPGGAPGVFTFPVFSDTSARSSALPAPPMVCNLTVRLSRALEAAGPAPVWASLAGPVQGIPSSPAALAAPFLQPAPNPPPEEFRMPPPAAAAGGHKWSQLRGRRALEIPGARLAASPTPAPGASFAVVLSDRVTLPPGYLPRREGGTKPGLRFGGATGVERRKAAPWRIQMPRARRATDLTCFRILAMGPPETLSEPDLVLQCTRNPEISTRGEHSQLRFRDPETGRRPAIAFPVPGAILEPARCDLL